MANIPLRAYIREIEGLIDSGQLEETVTHCRHVLQTYPKFVDIYRLLGKVFLEGRQFSNAADILQRVLSAIPDDFVSHVGMSIIREDEGNLDTAIWHMERAFESQPSNKAIQDELRRLFGRRDGMEPPKIRLTRGALAYMYAKGNLHDQAIAELHGALSDDPQRPDLLLLLATMNYLTGNKVEAVETCSNILKKFPYSLVANQILAIILPQTERAEDAKIYQQRAFALDPYLSKTKMDSLTSDQVPDGAIMIDTLERKPGQPIEGLPEQPAWAETLGVKFNGTEEEELPDWLTEDIVIPSYEGTHVAPFVNEEIEDVSSVEGDISEELIPEWMKDSGWQPSSIESEKQPSRQDISETEEIEDEIEIVEIPDWLKEHIVSDTLEEEIGIDATSEDAIPPWLDETTPGPTDSIISWLEEKDEKSKPSEAEPQEPPKEEVEIPEWLLDLDGEEVKVDFTSDVSTPAFDISDTDEEFEAEIIDELPEWMTELTEQTSREPIEPDESSEVITEEPVVEQPERFEEFEGLMGGLVDTDEGLIEIDADSSIQTIPEVEEVEELKAPEPFIEETSTMDEIEMPDWLENLEQEDDDGALFDETIDEPIEIPEWLQELGNITEVEELKDEIDSGIKPDLITETEELITTESQKESGISDQDLPIEDELSDWLEEDEERKEKTEILEPSEVPDEEAEWILEEDVIDTETIKSTLADTEAEVELSEEDAGLAWLEGLAEKQGISNEEEITSPEEHLTETPDLIQQKPADIDIPAEIQMEEEQTQEVQEEVTESDELEVQISVDQPLPLDEEHDLSTSGIDKEMLVRAREALDADDIDQALGIFDQLIKNDQNIEEVISLIEAETSKNPDNILLLQTLGDAYIRNDQFQQALDAYTKAEKLL